MNRCYWLFVAVLSLVAWMPIRPAAAECGPTYIERTVMIPQVVCETRMVPSVEYRWETRERAVTTYKPVMETAARTREVTEYVNETRTRTQNYTVYRPVQRTETQRYTVQVPEWRDMHEEYTVMVPHTETRQAMRTECRSVAVQETRQVCRDVGQWVNQTVQVPYCDPCCGPTTRTVCRPIWVAKRVVEQVPVTVYKTEQVEVPYTYQVTACRPETRTRTYKVCNYRAETRSREIQVCDYEAVQQTCEVPYTVCVPRTRTVSYNEVTCRYVPQQQTQQYQVCVAHQAQRPVQVQVCKMVPQTVRVPACPPSCCGPCCCP